MVRIDLVVADQNMEAAVKVIIQLARTGLTGDGKVLISDVKEAAFALSV
jgi:nitrogen regulatory protein PII